MPVPTRMCRHCNGSGYYVSREGGSAIVCCRCDGAGVFALSPTANEKPTNPKDIIGSDKLPLHLWPTTATALGSLALLDGALKYGRGNFRAVGVRASIYYDAALRHLQAWFEGEDNAPDSGLPHLAHALACLAIVVDAQAAGNLNDDRAIPGGYHALVASITEHVARLKAKHAGKDPRHYTLQDSGQDSGQDSSEGDHLP